MSDHLKEQHGNETIEERSDLSDVDLISETLYQPHVTPKKSGTSHVFEGLLPKAAQDVVSNKSANLANIPTPKELTPQDSESTTKRFHQEKHGNPHVFEGLLPDAASEIAPSQKGITLSETSLNDKRTESQIMDIRRRDMSQIRPPVQQITSQELGRISLIFSYLLAISTVTLTILTKDKPYPTNLISPIIGSFILLIISYFIYEKKLRARHHAAIFTAIATIILGIIILDYIKHGS
jgi:hypothetical protein